MGYGIVVIGLCAGTWWFREEIHAGDIRDVGLDDELMVRLFHL